MKDKNLNHSFTVDKTPKEVFDAINDVRGWWSGQIDGKTEKLGDEFTYRYKDFHRTTQKIIESIPGKKVVWLVTDSFLSFVEDKTEWNDTKVVFEITPKDGKTEVRFTHQGLTDKQECFDACNDAWGSYITGSLKNLIVEGKGQPNTIEKVQV
jgi:hypothetical protein